MIWSFAQPGSIRPLTLSTIIFICWSCCFAVLWENWPQFSRAIKGESNGLPVCSTDNQPAFILQQFFSLWFSSNWFDCNCCSQYYDVMSTLVGFPACLLPPPPSLLLPCLLRPPPCWGDLPCLLTDNSDRKLLHVITLLKSQFTQPQQIILRWVPRVMETVFSTLYPASPAPPKPWHSGQRRATSSSHPPPPPSPFFLPPFFYHWSLLRFSK